MMKEKEKEKIVGTSALGILGDYEEDQQRALKPSGVPMGSWEMVAEEEEREGVNFIDISKGKKEGGNEGVSSLEDGGGEDEDIDGEPLSDDEDIDGEPM